VPAPFAPRRQGEVSAHMFFFTSLIHFYKYIESNPLFFREHTLDAYFMKKRKKSLHKVNSTEEPGKRAGKITTKKRTHNKTTSPNE
jgi:hypothetical protein